MNLNAGNKKDQWVGNSNNALLKDSGVEEKVMGCRRRELKVLKLLETSLCQPSLDSCSLS